MTAQGTSKQRTIKEEQRPYLEATSIKIYGGNYLTEKQTSYACIGFETTSHEVYQFVLSNKQYTRELIKRHQSSKIKELTLKEALTSIKTIAKEDTDAKENNRFIECDFPHMKIKAWVKRRAYRVIANSQRNNRYQLPANTVYQSKEYIEQFLANSDTFPNFDLSCFYDQILCDALTSLLNTILYLGREFAPLTCPQGSTNAPLAATNIVRDILFHINDTLITQDMDQPRTDVNKLIMEKPSRRMTIRESYGNVAPIDLPGAKLVYQTIQRDTLEDGRRRRLQKTRVYIPNTMHKSSTKYPLRKQQGLQRKPRRS